MPDVPNGLLVLCSLSTQGDPDPMSAASGPFRVIHVDTDEQCDLMLAEFQDLPFLPVLARQLLRLLADPTEARCRQYQLSIAEHGFFTIASPSTGSPIASGDSVILPDRIVFYRFPDCPDLLVCASNLGRGYPLNAVVLLGPRILILVGEHIWGVRADHAAAVEHILQDPIWWPPRPANEVRLFTGDMNFAHHAWNQLSALETLLSGRPALAETTIFATFQPLGPLPALFADLGEIRCAWEHANIPAQHNQPGRVCVNPGGFLLTRSIRDRLQRLARSQCSPDIKARVTELAARPHPVFWISLRTRNRTMTNQTEVLSLLCRRIYEAFPGCTIILDGHSLPEDLGTNICYDKTDTAASVEADQAQASSIIAALQDHGLPGKDQRLLNAVGLRILDSLSLAMEADFYICHHGTVQHKIGWLTATPGFVHSNARTLQLSPTAWVSEQAEGSVPPCYIPEALVEDEVPDRAEDEQARSRLFESYRITDPEAFVDLVLETARQQMTLPKPPEGLATLARRFLKEMAHHVSRRFAMSRPKQ